MICSHTNCLQEGWRQRERGISNTWTNIKLYNRIHIWILGRYLINQAAIVCFDPDCEDKWFWNGFFSAPEGHKHHGLVEIIKADGQNTTRWRIFGDIISMKSPNGNLHLLFAFEVWTKHQDLLHTLLRFVRFEQIWESDCLFLGSNLIPSSQISRKRCSSGLWAKPFPPKKCREREGRVKCKQSQKGDAIWFKYVDSGSHVQSLLEGIHTVVLHSHGKWQKQFSLVESKK